MRKYLILFIILFCIPLFSQTEISKSSKNVISYIDPVPGAKLVKPQTTIIFRPELNLYEQSLLKNGSISINGSINGKYSYYISKSPDMNVYLIKTDRDFALNETITINFTDKIKLSSGNRIKSFSSEFKTIPFEIPHNNLQGLVNEIPETQIHKLLNNNDNTQGDQDFPQVTITNSNNPAAGQLLLSNIVFNLSIPNTPYLLILNNDGSPHFSRQMGGQIFNFDRQNNGNFTYFSRAGGKYYEMDSTYTIIDSFYTGNGYLTDLHELRVLSNRHALLLSYDKEVVDMSLLVPGGNPNALVTGLILQEIDENKNVVFQWRSWDHFQITDPLHEDLLSSEIDYVHGNAIEYDYDGNILLSSRHLDEITKINRSNGNILWRLGGKNNQFTFTNDPTKFSYQHGIRRLPNGNIILFDNGNYHSPNYSRAVEYSLNEVSLLATVIWEYRNTPVIYGNAMGFAQRLDNGNTLISWGSTNPTCTEVKPDGSKALQLAFNTGIFSYRVFKYDLLNNLTGIEPVNNIVPQNFELSQNFPNPFNPSTKIKFSIPGNNNSNIKNVKLTVYNILGEAVAVPVNESLKPGSYEISFDGSKLSSGVYYYNLVSENYSDTKKMILIK